MTVRTPNPITALWLASALAIAVAAPAQDPVRALKRAFRPAEDPAAAFAGRVAALDSLPTPIDDPKSVVALLGAWMRAHEDARAVERARGRPAVQQKPSLPELEERVALNGCLRLMAQIEQLLVGATGAGSDRVVAALLGDALPVQARAALVTVVTAGAAGVLGPARDALGAAQRPDDIWVALRALERIGAVASAAGPEIEPLLAHRESIVRTQAARTIAAIGHRAGAPVLIARLDQEDSRHLHQVAEALEDLTGQPLGTSTPSWRAWWAAEGEAFVAGRVDRPRPAAGGPARAARRGGTSGAYFGIPQDGRAVLYLVDFSKSMNQKLAGGDGPTRWDECAKELAQAIERLGPDRTFNVVVFAERAVAWSDRQVSADARNVAAAKGWIADLQLEFGTAAFEGFEVAFTLGGAHLEDRYFEAAVDTIFFLSDGLPTARAPASPGKLTQDDPELVAALIRRRNPFRSIVVHSIMLGRQGGGPFMKKIAEQNDGQFVRR